MAREIYINGFPKSGNTWLARLLGDVLDSPVKTVKGIALADEGAERKGDYVIRQHHLITPEDAFGVVYIYRDPRDVVVSAAHYWRIASLAKAQHCVAKGLWPTTHRGGWVQYHEPWRRIVADKNLKEGIAVTCYEALHARTEWEIRFICAQLGAETMKLIRKVVQRQSIEAKRQAIIDNPRDYTYNPDIQLRNLRKGIVGDWKNHYTRALGEQAQVYFGEYMLELGYIKDSSWWKELPE